MCERLDEISSTTTDSEEDAMYSLSFGPPNFDGNDRYSISFDHPGPADFPYSLRPWVNPNDFNFDISDLFPDFADGGSSSDSGEEGDVEA